MSEIRERLRYRAENKADSICYTYKQHFAAAKFLPGPLPCFGCSDVRRCGSDTRHKFLGSDAESVY